MSKNETIGAFFVGNEAIAKEMADKVKAMFVGVDGQSVSVSDVESMKTEMLYAPFFGHKVVSMNSRNFGVKEAAELLSIHESVPPECMLIVNGGPIPTKVTKCFVKIGQPKFRVMNYGVMADFKSASAFATKRVADKGGKITTAGVRSLVSVVGMDCNFLEGEIDKLMLMSDGKIDEKHVYAYAFPSESAEYYRLYSYLADGDAANAISESRNLVNRFDVAAVDQALMKVACICVRIATSSFTGCMDVKENRFNSDWWGGNGPGSGKPVPSSFMVDVSRKICDRHQNGVKYLLERVSSGFSMHRTSYEMPEGVLEMKILAICGRGRGI